MLPLLVHNLNIACGKLITINIANEMTTSIFKILLIQGHHASLIKDHFYIANRLQKITMQACLAINFKTS